MHVFLLSLALLAGDEAGSEGYEFKWPIRRVAIVGAGASALLAYRDFVQAGFEVRLFERDNVPGGNWHYTDEAPADTPVPNVAIPLADFVPSFAPAGVDLPYSVDYENDAEIRKDHRGPKPVWESLRSNAPSIPELPWPAGTKWELTHYQLRNYIRAFASYHNINSNDDNPAVSYNTRVELIEKRLNDQGEEQGWRLWLKKITPTGNNTSRATWWSEDFDAVTIASGRYNAAVTPSIPGLSEWVRRFSERISHSRQYRRPHVYDGKTVLIVGASVSGSEISRDINKSAKRVYQSIRANPAAHYRVVNYLRRIPSNTTIVSEIKQFLPLDADAPFESGRIELKNGTIITGIDHIIFATGFRYSFPFLPHYYDGAAYTPHEGSSRRATPFLPTDGSHIRDLYLDLFYIRDPTLALLGVNFGTQTFSYNNYLTLALAKVWSNTAKLPSVAGMWQMYDKVLEDRGGHGRHFQFLGPQRLAANIRFFMGWLNEAAVEYGGKQIDGLPQYTAEVNDYWLASHYGGALEENVTMRAIEADLFSTMGLDSLSFENMFGDKKEAAYQLMFDDNW
ncbi:FAD/NAD(P)-binding domain-containing protein [Leucogyrophana mollusca]|uniref:FAD/NAD(P)-binding domain-containing protein n=1 Tax=Leucogyrophana mollusca TaxID=85980 RepID=A0ACB8B8R0_9AGAM|nr:FAD/NAD(P)-binding domain-containing protein [Leucogyrophana mollusca]